MHPHRSPKTWRDTWADVRRSFSDFLVVPAATVAGFIALAVAIYTLDRTRVGWLEPARALLAARLVTGPDTTNALLGTIAGGVITVTSITFSLLLLAVQQSAGALTAQVLDQFLRRRLNQLYFGVFVGIALFALIILATTDARVTPVFGAATALVLTLVALTVLVVLLYTTLNQMRPHRIVEAIHDLTLVARDRQLPMIRRTRRASLYPSPPVTLPVHSPTNGYVAAVHLEHLGRVTGAAAGPVEVVLLVSMGDYVCFGDVIAEVRAASRADAEALCTAARGALSLERQRNLHVDAGYGVFQLAMIAWTSVSTAKSNPAPGLAALRVLRDLLARWSADDADAKRAAEPHAEEHEHAGPPLPVVYRDDVFESVIETFESIGVVASESMQHQSCAEVIDAIAIMFDRLPRDSRRRAEDAVLRTLSSLGDHVLTAPLDRALDRLAGVLAAAGRFDTAAAVQRAHAALATSVGTLNSRATRVPDRDG